MTETMIQRVAKEIADKARHTYSHDPEGWDAVAVAAITAIRAADEDMLKAMHVAMFQDPFDSQNLPMLGAGFEAAIDAALSEGGE